ncbi:MAG: TIGR04283 family arsenosugar biosynthesis glycosyltransferase [Mariprofundus sp.]|nr:TIGR04283 family arsenosugar biosynthesis glycosyltransferase [Mariprofundus sp.]
MKRNLSIAIIVPVFNEATVLPELIGRMQSVDTDTLIVVDGGSRDDSHRLLENSGIRWCQSEPGRAAQMNAGAEESTNDILLFIHADTIINSSNISAMCEAMEDGSYAGGRFDLCLSGNAVAFRIIEWLINVRSRLTGISTGDQCQFVRRSVFEQMGGFPDQPLMEDVEFSKRLKRHGRVACLREKVITSSRRWEQLGIVATIWLMWKLRFLYWFGVSPEKLAQMYRQTR